MFECVHKSCCYKVSHPSCHKCPMEWVVVGLEVGGGSEEHLGYLDLYRIIFSPK